MNDLKEKILRNSKKIWYKTGLIAQKYKSDYDKDTVNLVYSMGKVGSDAVRMTLLKYQPFVKTFHMHFLSDQWKRKVEAIGMKYNSDIKNYLKTKKYLNDNNEKRVKIITLVRDPISRQISEFFQNYDKRGINLKNTSIEEIIVDILKKDRIAFPLNWFDNEFINFTGIDIYKYEFDKEKGYTIIQANNYDVLVIKLEKLNEVFHEAFMEFLKINIPKLEKSNLGKNKSTAKLQNQVKIKLKVNEEQKQMIYSSKMVKHFYTNREIQKFIKKWTV